MPSVPTKIEGPVVVIGDVHGQTSKLQQIVKKLAALPDINQRWIVFIGDLVDRGPDSKGTIDAYCQLADQHRKVTCVCGNHELAMAGSIGLINVPDFVDWPSRWLPHYDSDKTFASYGVPFGELDALREALPERHAQLISDLPWSVEHAQYLFVHAGLDNNLPFEMQVNILRQRRLQPGASGVAVRQTIRTHRSGDRLSGNRRCRTRASAAGPFWRPRHWNGYHWWRSG